MSKKLVKKLPEPSNYPMDFITYTDAKGKLPPYTDKVVEDVLSKGFNILPMTPDNYKVVKAGTKKEDIPADHIGSWHAGFKHLRDITVPKLLKLKNENPKIRGFLIAEADLCLSTSFNFNKFISVKTNEPTWFGWKKILLNKGNIDYVVGNFLIYMPVDKLDDFNTKLQKKKSLVYSDRFYTNLVKEGWLQLHRPSAAGEIVHTSSIIGGRVRTKSKSEEECKLTTPHAKILDVQEER